MKIYVKKSFNGKRLFAGFMGIGGTGLYTIKHMIDSLEGVELVGIVDSPYIPPVISYIDGRISYPIEFYRHGDDLILKVENLPRGPRGNILIKNLLRYVKKKGVEEIIVIGGLTKNLREGEEDEYRIVTNRYWRRKITARPPPKYVKIFGPLASTLAYSEFLKIPALGILAYSDDGMIDPIAASYAVKAINELFGYEIPIDTLRQAANELNEMMRQFEEFVGGSGKDIYT